MADQKQYKSPEELEAAVGHKIDELFGGLFGEDDYEKTVRLAPEFVGEATEAPAAKSRDEAAAEESAQAQKQRAVPAPVKKAPAPVAPPRPAQSRPAPAVPSPRIPLERPKTGDAFQDIAEEMEILLLNLEWEVSPDNIKSLAKKFKELEGFFPGEGQAKTILAMNRRGLQRFGSPDAVPHPSLIKLVQDSIAALKMIRSSRGKRPASDTLIAALTRSYKEIMGSPLPGEAAPTRAAVPAAQKQYPVLMNNVGTAIRSLEEVSQRLARILGVLRQGGDMSTEEITRRLGTVENLLSERVGQLASFHRDLGEVSPPAADAPAVEYPVAPEATRAPEGFLMLVWEGTYVAIPASSVCALYPLTKVQASQVAGKETLLLGTRPIRRLPLKKPKSKAGKAVTLPAWLVHLAKGGKDYFLLVDRSLGFRVSPGAMDLSHQKQVKFGNLSFAILNPAALR